MGCEYQVCTPGTSRSIYRLALSWSRHETFLGEIAVNWEPADASYRERYPEGCLTTRSKSRKVTRCQRNFRRIRKLLGYDASNRRTERVAGRSSPKCAQACGKAHCKFAATSEACACRAHAAPVQLHNCAHQRKTDTHTRSRAR